jgi:hypothetical protein
MQIKNTSNVSKRKKVPVKPMRCNAYFISPDGEVIPAPNRHIDLVDATPELFGLTEKYLDRIYKKHGEARGSECCARREFLKRIKDKGWIRVRIVFDVSSGKYVVNFDLNRNTDSAKERIAKFILQMEQGKIQSGEYWIRKPGVKVWNECEGRIFQNLSYNHGTH